MAAITAQETPNKQRSIHESLRNTQKVFFTKVASMPMDEFTHPTHCHAFSSNPSELMVLPDVGKEETDMRFHKPLYEDLPSYFQAMAKLELRSSQAAVQEFTSTCHQKEKYTYN